MLEINRPEKFLELSEEHQEFLLDWISRRFMQVQDFNSNLNSYVIKDLLEYEHHNLYFCNGELKGAILASGYKVQNKNKINWVFNIQKRSEPRASCSMLSFKEWLKTTCYHTFQGIEGDLVRDIMEDTEFPYACEKYVMYIYLSRLSEMQIRIFENLYDEYIKFISRRYPDGSTEELDD